MAGDSRSNSDGRCDQRRLIGEANIRTSIRSTRTCCGKTGGRGVFDFARKDFGSEAETIANAFDEDSERLFRAGAIGRERQSRRAFPQADGDAQAKIARRKDYCTGNKNRAENNPVRKNRPKSTKVGFTAQPKFDWRQFAFGFQPLPQLPQPSQDETPEIKFTQTDNEISASGETSKNFETAEAKGKRTQKAETRHINDGTNIGIEIKNTTIIEAVSKTRRRNFSHRNRDDVGRARCRVPGRGRRYARDGKGQSRHENRFQPGAVRRRQFRPIRNQRRN